MCSHDGGLAPGLAGPRVVGCGACYVSTCRGQNRLRLKVHRRCYPRNQRANTRRLAATTPTHLEDDRVSCRGGSTLPPLPDAKPVASPCPFSDAWTTGEKCPRSHVPAPAVYRSAPTDFRQQHGTETVAERGQPDPPRTGRSRRHESVPPCSALARHARGGTPIHGRTAEAQVKKAPPLRHRSHHQ